jgi:hypothetical protein
MGQPAGTRRQGGRQPRGRLRPRARRIAAWSHRAFPALAVRHERGRVRRPIPGSAGARAADHRSARPQPHRAATGRTPRRGPQRCPNLHQRAATHPASGPRYRSPSARAVGAATPDLMSRPFCSSAHRDAGPYEHTLQAICQRSSRHCSATGAAAYRSASASWCSSWRWQHPSRGAGLPRNLSRGLRHSCVRRSV